MVSTQHILCGVNEGRVWREAEKAAPSDTGWQHLKAEGAGCASLQNAGGSGWDVLWSCPEFHYPEGFERSESRGDSHQYTLPKGWVLPAKVTPEFPDPLLSCSSYFFMGARLVQLWDNLRHSVQGTSVIKLISSGNSWRSAWAVWKESHSRAEEWYSYVSTRSVFGFASLTFQLCDSYLENGMKLSLFKLLMQRFKLDEVGKSVNDLGWTRAYVKNPVIGSVARITAINTIVGSPQVGRVQKGLLEQVSLVTCHEVSKGVNQMNK